MGKKQLTLVHREILARLRNDGNSLRYIAKYLGFSASAICQELKRNSRKNGPCSGRYFPEEAQMKTRNRRIYANRKNKRGPAKLDKYIKEMLKLFWSPEQITGRLKIDYPDDLQMRISFKTIYNMISGTTHNKPCIRSYRRCLRYKHVQGKSFKHGRKKAAQEVNRNLRSIKERPGIVDIKGRVGDWEADLICGKGRSGYMVTFVERKNCYLYVFPCSTKNKDQVSQVMKTFMQKVRPQYRKTMTVDRGGEFFGYESIEAKYGTKFYFCHPQSPQERGLNENSNGLLRQFFPKKMNFSGIGQKQINKVVDLINNRPRKKFGYRSPRELLEQQGISFC